MCKLISSCFLFPTEWRIPHLYPVLHQLPTVRWHRVWLNPSLCLFTASAYCTKPIFSLSLLSHLDLTSTYCLPSLSHGSFVYQSMHYLFSLPWQTDMLYRNHLSRSQIVYWLLCLGVSASLPPFFLLHFFFLYSFIHSLLTELQPTRWMMGYYSCHLIVLSTVNVLFCFVWMWAYGTSLWKSWLD